MKNGKIICWDEPKRLANVAKHGLDFNNLTLEFFRDALIVRAKNNRLAAIGRLDDGTITTIFITLGFEALSVISMRPASIKERKHHDSTI